MITRTVFDMLPKQLRDGKTPADFHAEVVPQYRILASRFAKPSGTHFTLWPVWTLNVHRDDPITRRAFDQTEGALFTDDAATYLPGCG